MEIIIRAAVVFTFLYLLMRALGKRELAELSAFELVLFVTIGDIVQQGVTQEDMSLTGAGLAVGTMAGLILLLSWVAFRFPQLRRPVDGVPAVVVRDGVILRHVLKIERMTEEDVHEEARMQGIGDLAAVRIAVLEPDGRFSFIRRDGEQHQAEESMEQRH